MKPSERGPLSDGAQAKSFDERQNFNLSIATGLNKSVRMIQTNLYGEFDSGSERTLAAWIRHASRTDSYEIISSVGQWRTGA